MLTLSATHYPYGGTRSGAMPTDYRYTGQRQETGLGLYDYNARYYDPSLGRFIQADSIVPEPGNPQAFNRYAYVYNNPLKHVDVSGHFPWIIVGGLVGMGIAYGGQVVGNMHSGMELGEALTTNIDLGTVATGGLIGMAVGTGVGLVAPVVVGAVGGGTAATTASGAAAAAGTLVLAEATDGEFNDERQAVETLVGMAHQLKEVGVNSSEGQGLLKSFTEAVTHNPSSGHTVLGHYPQYVDYATERGYTYFGMPNQAWDALGSDTLRWAVNEQFLKNALARGDTFVFPGSLDLARGVSGFYQELEYLGLLEYFMGGE